MLIVLQPIKYQEMQSSHKPIINILSCSLVSHAFLIGIFLQHNNSHISGVHGFMGLTVSIIHV